MTSLSSMVSTGTRSQNDQHDKQKKALKTQLLTNCPVLNLFSNLTNENVLTRESMIMFEQKQ